VICKGDEIKSKTSICGFLCSSYQDAAIRLVLLMAIIIASAFLGLAWSLVLWLVFYLPVMSHYFGWLHSAQDFGNIATILTRSPRPNLIYPPRSTANHQTLYNQSIIWVARRRYLISQKRIHRDRLFLVDAKDSYRMKNAK
jgi:hypothetical protein